MADTKDEKRKFVLVVEDDSFYSNIYNSKLTKAGYIVSVAGNGDIALAIARKQKPDLILLDLILPVKDGFETLKAIRSDQDLAKVKVIAISNLAQEEDVQRAKHLGANDYFVKTNISIQDVVNMVKKQLGD